MKTHRTENGDFSPLEKLLPNVPRETKNQLAIFLDLIFTWQGKINLTGAKTPQEFCRHHILDAIGAETVVTKNKNCLDVGSGVGVPGLIWSLLRPGNKFYLIEPLQKRAAFLQRVIAELKLKNVKVIPKAFEAIGPGEIKDIGEQTPQIVSRGTKSPPQLWPLIMNSPIPFSEWLIFSSKKTHGEFISFGKDSEMKIFRLDYTRPDHTPGILTRIIPPFDF